MLRNYYLAIAVLSVLVATCICEDPPKQVNLDDLIKNIFNTNDPQPQPQPQPLPNTTPTFRPEPTKTTVLNPEPNPFPNPVPNPGPNTVPNPNPHQQDSYKSCGYEKECVPRFLCQDDSINTDGTNIIDIRIDGGECGYLETCCDIPNKRDKPIIDPVPTEQHVGCGFRNPDGVGFRITGDNDHESEFGEFPWMVAILREEEAAGEILNLYECGGALITKSVVLTAAHCVLNRVPNTLVVRAGEWDTQSKAEVLPYQDLRVKEVITHEQYNKGALFNDIALLVVDGAFEWQENVRPVCLPQAQEVFDHSRCFATGWGKDQFGREGKYQVILKKIDLPVVPRDKCQAALRTTRLGKYFQLHESFICAGGEKGKDTCKGDGGSPLVCPIPGAVNRYYQAGIVAWGIGCGEQNIPGVYASVAHLRRWVDMKMSQRGFTAEEYTPL